MKHKENITKNIGFCIIFNGTKDEDDFTVNNLQFTISEISTSKHLCSFHAVFGGENS